MAKICPVCETTYPDTSAFCPTDGTTLISENVGNDLVGSVVADRYLVERLLGEGGMGRVYLARHVRLPQQAAIKVLHPGMIADPEAVARFNREAANAARIEHDRVARVFDFGETRNGSVYLAMEYVPGRSLHGLVAESGRLPAARAARITYQVAEGLDAAHRIGIVHRDLKPDNIMVVTEDGGVDRCKVVDFGIAKAADAGSRTRLTRTGMVVGTPEFMSPEQFLGEELDARSDVYALALVAYNAFTGALPFVATTPERAMAARMMEAPRPLSVAVPEVDWPSEVQAAFDRALERDPAARTATALEFGEAVVAAVEQWTGEPVLRGRTPLSTRSITPPSSSTVPTPRSTQPMPIEARLATPAPAAAPKSSGGMGKVVAGVGGVVLVAVVGYFAMSGGGEGTAVVPEPPVSSVGDSTAGAATNTPPVARRESSTQPQGTAPQTQAQGTTVAPPPSNAPAPTVPAGRTAEPETDPDAIAQRDSIRDVLIDDSSGEAEARAAVPALERLLPRMATALDSTWTYLVLVSAHAQGKSPPTRACAALRNADRLAASPRQRTAVTQMFESQDLPCVR